MKRAFLLGLLAVLAVASGCYSTAAKQAYYGVTGASERFFALRDIAGPTALDRYKAVAVQPFDPSPLLGALPAEAVSETQRAIIQRLTETRMFEAVGPNASVRPALFIRGRFVDYDPGQSPLRAVGFGENPFLTAQIELIDGDTGQAIGVAMVSGTNKSAVRSGTKEVADGVGKGVKSLVEHHHTKPAKEGAQGSGQGGAPQKGFRLPWSK